MHTEGENQEHGSVTSFNSAVEDAIQQGVDILNISAGDRWFGPPSANPYSKIIDKALANGIIVAAAAGNLDGSSDHEPIHCPAAHSDVIAVAGMLSECPQDPAEHDYPDDELEKGPYKGATTSFQMCSYRECIGDSSCITSQTEKPWPRNPDPIDGKPDIAAPVAYPDTDSDGKINLYAGTSYATPIVSGTLGMVLGELREAGVDRPTPRETREVLKRNSVQMDEGTLEKPDITRVIKDLTST